MINNKEKNFVSAVVYLKNDEEYVEKFIKKVSNVLDNTFETYELICVDDASSDKTVDKIRDVSKTLDKCVISIIKLSNPQGYEAAMNAGVNLAIGDYVFEFDTPYIDYDESLISDIYFRSLTGYDIVSATNSNYKKYSSNLFYKVFNKSSDLQYDIKSENFRVVSRRAINKIYSMSSAVKYRKAFYANCGLKTDNIEYNGDSKPRKIAKAEKNYRQETAVTSLMLFTNVAYKISIAISLLMMFATIFMAVYSVAVFAVAKAVAGFTTTMLVITGAFFGVFVLLAVIIKYLSVLTQLVFNKQEYRIESIEKISKR